MWFLIWLTACGRNEIIQSMFLDDNGIKLEINNRDLTGKALKTWKLKDHISKYAVNQSSSLKENKTENWMKMNEMKMQYFKICRNS